MKAFILTGKTHIKTSVITMQELDRAQLASTSVNKGGEPFINGILPRTGMYVSVGRVTGYETDSALLRRDDRSTLRVSDHR